MVGSSELHNCPVSAFSLATEQRVQKTIYVEPWAISGSLTMAYAPRGEGKSLFCNFLAHSIATGSHFLGKEARTSRVIYFDGEMGPHQVASRISKAAVNRYPKEMNENLAYFTFADSETGTMPNLADKKDQEIYTQVSANFDVIIIDNLLTCSFPVNARDDDVTTWQRLQPLLIEWRESGKCVILVHHTSKSGQQYGTILKENLMDTIIAIRKCDFVPSMGNDLNLEIRFEKNRNHFKDCDKAYLAQLRFGATGFESNKLNLDFYRKQELKNLERKGLPLKFAAEKLNLSYIDAKLLTLDEPEGEDRYESDDLHELI